MYVVLSESPRGVFTLTYLTDSGENDPEQPSETYEEAELAGAVEALELERPRWVWADTGIRYPGLLAHGVRVERCHDLRLTHAILRASSLTAASALAAGPRSAWDAPLMPSDGVPGSASSRAGQTALFDGIGGAVPQAGGVLSGGGGGVGDSGQEPDAVGAAEVNRLVAEFRLQLDAIRTATEPNRLRLLLAAESAGALIAAEMSHAGLPWREDVHDALLTELLGEQVAPGLRPARLEQLAVAVRAALGTPQLNPDSPADLLRALRFAGLMVTTTRSYELQSIEHPVIAPLLEYKKLSRLLSANGWSWMASWVTNGRFSPDYVPGGVVSGRWATRGGGALQLPKQVRRAVTADDGWVLVVADAAQLEPRILAGVSGDTVMAAAGRGTDLYAGIVSAGALETRAQAKVAMLGAMYGATTGESGRLLPRLARAFPTALRYVEDAARAGERGEVVTSRLGRSAPRPNEEWWEAQARASEGTPNERAQQFARQQARDWGRFTRNFVVQASAADWALCWMADLRRRLADLAPADDAALDEPLLDDAPLADAAQDAELSFDDAAPDAVPSLDATTPHADPSLDGISTAPTAAAGSDDAVTHALELLTGDNSAASLDPVAAAAAAKALESARRAAVEAEITERERRIAAPSPFKAADPVADMARRLAELRSSGASVRPVALHSEPAPVVAPAPAVTAPPSTSTPRTPPRPPSGPSGTSGTSVPSGPSGPSQARPTPPVIDVPPSGRPVSAPTTTAGRAAKPFTHAPHLVFFLHDELIVHAPAELADAVADALRDSAAAATRLLFGAFPLDVPLDVSIVASYADAD
nr:bifunctional 3'-5' exonuclease/DNA polymerase [Subtercola vilae]